MYRRVPAFRYPTAAARAAGRDVHSTIRRTIAVAHAPSHTRQENTFWHPSSNVDMARTVRGCPPVSPRGAQTRGRAGEAHAPTTVHRGAGTSGRSHGRVSSHPGARQGRRQPTPWRLNHHRCSSIERASSEENLWEKRVRRDGWHRGDGAVCGPRAQARWNAVAGDVRWHRGPAARRAASAAAPVRASADLPQPREARRFGRLQRRALRPGRRRTTVGG